MGTKVNVTVLTPDASVRSMQDEIADGSVDRAVKAAVAAYQPIDSDETVDVVTYDEDFDNAVERALQTAKGTAGRDLLVIVTDLETNDAAKAERLLASLDDDFVVIVTCSNQGQNDAWAKQLDDNSPAADKIDVISVAGLSDHDTAYAKVGPWQASA